MLAACGLASADQLFSQIPAEARIHGPLDLAPGISEYEIVDYFRSLSDRASNGFASFLGAGVYNHYRPTVVDTVNDPLGEAALRRFPPHEARIQSP